jgi:nucleotide-binding universal stress UspA family protein
MTRYGVPPGSVVVGVDGSEDSERAVAWAAQQSVLERRPLAIVHSSEQVALRDTAWLDVQGIDHRVLTAGLAEAARAIVASARERAAAAAPGVEVVSTVVDDDPRLALTTLSDEARLVVVGSRGRGPLLTTLLGSVSASVVRHARCPVVVCRPPDREHAPAAKIVVGVDGSPASRPVLEFAFAQASLRDLPLTVMHCFWDVTLAATGPGVVPPGGADEYADLRVLLAQSVAGLAEKYPDVDVTRELSQGLVDQCLTEASPAAELIVVGRTATHGLARFLHSSCAVAVLERARTTVAVVPESD